MKLELTVSDRIAMQAIFPVEANIDNILMGRDIKRRVEITKEDKERIGYQEKRFNDNLKLSSWSKEKDFAREFEFSEAETNLMKTVAEKLHKTEKVREEMVDLLVKIRNWK